MDKLKDIKLSGKTVIITGANCGIGYETALDLAKRDARVIIACRDEKKAQEAVAKIKQETKNESVEYELLNLASLKSIKEFCDRIKAKCSKIDILINNAGIAGMPYVKTEDGFETHFGVNHLGHFYLTNLLLDLIKSSAPSRIINVSSGGHRGIKMNWDDLQAEKSYAPFFAYRQSKLANCLFTIELAKRLKDSGVTVVSLHPGAVDTEITRDREGLSFGYKVILNVIGRPLMHLFGKSCKDGAKTSIYCALADDVVNHSGAYYDNCKVTTESAEAKNMESAIRLWEISSKLVGLEKV